MKNKFDETFNILFSEQILLEVGKLIYKYILIGYLRI